MAVKASLLALALAATRAACEGACLPAEGSCASVSGGDHLLMQVKHSNTKVAQHKHQGSEQLAGYPGSGEFVASEEWCKGEVPTASWSLEKCGAAALGKGLEVKVMSYNLFWWHLFGIEGGRDGSAGKIIAGSQDDGKYDFMAFQECDDVNRIFNDARNAGLSNEYATLTGNHALGIIYRSSKWSLIEQGADDVAEDRADQWWGTRGAQWARFEHKATKKTAMLVNHHGPLPVGTGGKCGGQATAFNILRTIATRGQETDAVIVMGDFNADMGSATFQELSGRLHHVFTGPSFGGIDHIFSTSCDAKPGKALGGGGSDHEAVSAKITI